MKFVGGNWVCRRRLASHARYKAANQGGRFGSVSTRNAPVATARNKKRRMQTQAPCIQFFAAPTLERDPHSELHLPRSPVRVRARTSQNPVQARGAERG